jgi:hypothetical protein
MAKPKLRSSSSEPPMIVEDYTKPEPAKQAVTVVEPPLPAGKQGIRHKDYASEGVKDHDIFLLPASDYQIMLVTTLVAAIVRVFRIYQPSSVVFDEVQ